MIDAVRQGTERHDWVEMAWTEQELLTALRRWEAKLVADGRTPGTVTTYVRDARAFIVYVAIRTVLRSLTIVTATAN